MKRIAIIAMVLCLATTMAMAQEAQDEPMFVSITFVSVKPEMTNAFMAAIADHLDWHKSTNDTHYYGVSQAVSGPRTGQMVFVAGPMTGAQMDDYDAFGQQDMGDIAARGVFGYVDAVETIVMQTMPGFGNPPPVGYTSRMAQVFELDLDAAKVNAFTQALTKMNEAEKAIGLDDDYVAWLSPISGTSFSKRWVVVWVDSWAEMGNEDAERQAKLVEAAGGQEAFEAIVGDLMGAVVNSTSTMYVSMPQLSFRPSGQ